MKKCPNCNQLFTDDNSFCLDDGTLLMADTGQHGFGGFKSSGEMPTQYIPLRQNAQSQPVVMSQSSKWVFPLVGVLCGLVVVFGFFAFFKESSSDKAAVSQKNTEVGESNKNIEPRPLPQIESTPVLAIPSSNAYSYGRFPEGSTRLLTNDDLYGKSSWDLRIMRNEIFARHGYIFKKPELRQYFSSQSWYVPRFADVSGFLSNAESQNAQFLKNHE